MGKSALNYLTFIPFLLALCVSVGGCVNGRKGLVGTNSILSGVKGLVPSGTSADTIPSSCLVFTPYSVERSYCTSCYSSVLASHCPGASDPNHCTDPAAPSEFSQWLTACINQAIAGQINCHATVCGPNEILDPATCACIKNESGPPVMNVSLAGQDRFGALGTSSAPGGSCLSEVTASTPLWIKVTNRGGTYAQQNTYSTPTIGVSFNANGEPLVTSAQVPMASALSPPGLNSYLTLQLTSGGSNEILRSAGASSHAGVAGRLKHISGTPGVPLSDTSEPPKDVLSSHAAWHMPGFGTRDVLGNLFFVDSTNGLPDGQNRVALRVICNDTRTTGGGIYNPWCANLTRGSIQTVVAGSTGTGSGCQYANSNNTRGCSGVSVAGGTDGRPSIGTGAPGFLGGIAVDRYSNVYFADSQRHVVGVVCGTTSAGYCVSRQAKYTYWVLGISGLPESTGAAINTPWGLDIETEAAGSRVNFYLAERGLGRLRVGTASDGSPVYAQRPLRGGVRILCGFDPGLGFCRGKVPGATLYRPAYVNLDLSTGSLVSALNLKFAPSDVKVNAFGNVFYTDYDPDTAAGAVRALCFDSTQGDLCKGSGGTAGSPVGIVVAGTYQTGDSGDGEAAISAKMTMPFALLVGKAYAGQSASSVAPSPIGNFMDNNLIVLESFFPGVVSGTLSAPAGGNAVRVICGDNTTAQSAGFCSGKAVGSIHRLAGIYGSIPKTSEPLPAGLATQNSFSGLLGITYDGYKNLVVSSGSFVYIDPYGNRGNDILSLENSLRLIQFQSESTPSVGITYGVMDTLGQSSAYCLRAKALTACHFSDGSLLCECEGGKASMEILAPGANCP